VEDEPSRRTLVARLLADQGYTVLAAGTGEQALELADAFEGNIDLVVTDVVMPGVGGQSLARMLHARRPATRFLLMSGYAPNGPGPDGGAEPGWAFLQKPFTARILARKVRETLDVTAG
jgi:CheY-like chemotaxis protein